MATVLTGIPRDAVKGHGGIKRVFLALFADVSAKTVTEGVASFEAAAGAFKEFVLGKESGSNYAETMTGNVQAGTTQYEQILTMIFKKNQVAKRNEAAILAASETIAVIEDNNGDIFVYGLENGCDVTTDVSASGAQYGEANSKTITLRALERQTAPGVSSSDYEKIVAGDALGA